jgi:hypothetical protein
MKKLSNEEVINRFIKVHGTELYDYSKVQYHSKGEKITVICKKHHFEFIISPDCHWRGQSGCITCSKEKRINTNLEKYGVENPFQSDVCKEKSKITCLEKYGFSHPMKNDDVKETLKQSFLLNFGVENPQQNERVRLKTKETCLNNYGVEYPLQNTSVLSKVKSTNIEKYGVENQFQREEVKEIIKLSNIEKYGVECQLSNLEFKRNSMFKKYGVFNPMQHKLFFNAAIKTSAKRKEFLTPSGQLVFLQGYEPQVLKYLLKLGFEEKDFDFQNIPVISYNENKKYHPDIFIKSKNLIIEVKSWYTYKKTLKINLQKKKATIANGYNFNFYIWDDITGRLTIL